MHFFRFFRQGSWRRGLSPDFIFALFEKGLDELFRGRYNTPVKSEEGGNLEQMDADSCQGHIRELSTQIATGWILA